ncbi:lysophospholipid acyltransferase family protein [Alkaliphilus hydrothermalis]|uniref:1-acyl-sn-glycerol-3-phosphate acyltransferase n=1 Tax=Alkaliphilus hydrothermalis TaxID=1482730 RepID=A0ABS2NL67_9FIRM|nr:lysophospholipid acyltransferase family protein [Alkaliphilus hydrothermalis]MBM7613647.1 1-acyl-sn-glycerol-3-phosphate acyltransferase [Alkaliphilus hydrothermalis]
MKVYFNEDTYHTPADTQRFLLDRLSLGTRYYFHYKFAQEILRAKKIADAGNFNRGEWAEASYRIMKNIEKCGGKFHLTGLNNLVETQKPLVLVSNHMSTLETMVFPCIIAPRMSASFVIKASLATHPYIGSIMRARKPIVVDRVNPREDLQKVMTEGQEMLASGRSVIIFPQSTRASDFIPEDFNTLGIKLAKRANVPIMPIAIKTDMWENGKYIRDLGPIDRSKHIHMAFGKSMEITGNGKETHKEILRFIGEHMNQWRQEK